MDHFYPMDGRKYYIDLEKVSGNLFQRFKEFDKEVFQQESALPRKYKELIAIALAHTTQCPYCIETHVKNAYKAGASDEEIAEAIFIAAAIRAGGAIAHSTIAMATLKKCHERS